MPSSAKQSRGHTVYLDDQIWLYIRRLALDTGQTASDVVRQAVVVGLPKVEAELKKANGNDQ